MKAVVSEWLKCGYLKFLRVMAAILRKRKEKNGPERFCVNLHMFFSIRDSALAKLPEFSRSFLTELASFTPGQEHLNPVFNNWMPYFQKKITTW